MTDEAVGNLKAGVGEAIKRTSELAKTLPGGRASAIVLRSLDDARLWLAEVPGTDPAGKKPQ